MRWSLNNGCKSLSLDDGKQSQCWACGLPGARLPFADETIWNVEVAGEHAAAHAFARAHVLDIAGRELFDEDETCDIELVHYCSINETQTKEAHDCPVRDFERIAAVFATHVGFL